MDLKWTTTLEWMIESFHINTNDEREKLVQDYSSTTEQSIALNLGCMCANGGMIPY